MSLDPDSSAVDRGAHPEVAPGAAWPARAGGATLAPLVPGLLLVTVLTLATRAAAAVKELLVAQRFGISQDLDAFIVASLLPASFLYAVAASAAEAFLPVFARERVRGADVADRLVGSAVMLSAAVLGVLAIALAVVAPLAVRTLGSGLTPAASDLAGWLLLALLPTLLLGGPSAVWSAVLNASGRQNVTASVPLVTPLATIFLLVGVWPAWGIGLLAAGAVGGAVVEASILAIAIARIGRRVLPAWRSMDRSFVTFARQFAGLALAAFISLASAVLDQAMAASIGPGAASTFSYAGKIMVLVSGTAGIVLTFVVLPRLAQLVVIADRGALTRVIRRGLLLSIAGGCVVAVPLVLGSTPLVAALFERGAFDSAATQAVAPVQALLAVQLPFTLASLFAIRVLVAVGAARWIVLTAALSVVLHVAGNLALMPLLGVSGIALSVSISSVVMSAILSAAAFRRASRLVPAVA